MEGKESAVIYLDTHVVVWLFEGLLAKLSKKAIDLIEENSLCISPILQLELTYLQEIKKLNRSPNIIIRDLMDKIGLKICEIPFEEVVTKAQSLSWTRDPFDRLMVAQAMCNNSKLLTKDRLIHKNSKIAVWD